MSLPPILSHSDFPSFSVRFSVVTQGYNVEAKSVGGGAGGAEAGVPRGCSARLRCAIPSHVREWVRVVAWVREPSSLYIYPSLHGGEYSEPAEKNIQRGSIPLPPRPLPSNGGRHSIRNGPPVCFGCPLFTTEWKIPCCVASGLVPWR
ncbi:hypothetical protein J437_LFUL009998 [Ladona fulva]|uniref:Uncharacterized protein n=1 Tax=Ladona fulva TaxID=123851 RepID=A0A8K0P1X5_LADFU|nr:hypothetical protein J437_LFUL009998 [Ladona fulva]